MLLLPPLMLFLVLFLLFLLLMLEGLVSCGLSLSSFVLLGGEAGKRRGAERRGREKDREV